MRACCHGLVVIFLMLVSPIACRAADETNVFAINRLIGRGINIGNALEAPIEGAWGVRVPTISPTKVLTGRPVPRPG